MKNKPDYENLSLFKQIKTALEKSLAHGRGELILKATTLRLSPRRQPLPSRTRPPRRIRVETLNRSEKAKVTADVAAMEKINKALAG
ncbi:MAG: hypothetical protein ABSH22_00970 [Tepidisphaeraceae bacterium]